jgi:hypothetical protein
MDEDEDLGDLDTLPMLPRAEETGPPAEERH